MSQRAGIFKMESQPYNRAAQATTSGRTGVLRRKCVCGQHTLGGAECDGCGEKRSGVQRRAHSPATASPASGEAPTIVHEALRSPGQPLDTQTRAFFEPRLASVLGTARLTPHALAPQRLTLSQPGDFHEREADRIAERALGPDAAIYAAAGGADPAPRYDLSRIRVHTDGQAARAAHAVNALAFTVGEHVVFGEGFYAPRSATGRHLLAHELAHTAQQSGLLSRRQPGELPPHIPKAPVSSAGACLGSAVCNTIKPPTKLLDEAHTESQTRREKRAKLCKKVPPDPGCRSDGHAARAVETEKLLTAYDRLRLKNAVGIFVDKDMEANFKAVTTSCSNFTPPLAASGVCITVPAKTEENAALFNSTTGPLTIDGMERGRWRQQTIEILVHEVGHVDFRAAFAKDFIDNFSRTTAHIMGKQRPGCKADEASQVEIFQSVNELTAMLQEFPLRKEYIRISVSLQTPQDKEAELEKWRAHRILGTSQSITNSLRTVRCLCACQDADDLIRETIVFATASWNINQKNELHREMRAPRWSSLGLRWPFIAPPLAPVVPRPVP